MKLGVSYNVFDGEELLCDSILSIRESVDYISVIYQEISNFGDNCSPDLLELLETLQVNGFIDEIIKYIPNISMGGHYNELAKRNLGLSKSKENGCTHHLSMDTDEFYDKTQFEACKAFIIEHNMDSSACQMVTYYKDSNYRLEPKEEYYVSFIVKINDDTNYSIGNRFPVTVDPTRKVNAGKCVIFERDDIEMHHMSYVRKDIRKKLNNSSARGNFANNIENIAQHYDNWEFPNKALTAGINNTYINIVETPKLFDITFLSEIEIVDVVILSDEKSRSLTLAALDSLFESEKEFKFNVIVIEKSDYYYDNVINIKIDEDFNYNRFMNIGASKGNANYIVFTNNDVIFNKNWFSKIKAFNYDCSSPRCPFDVRQLNIKSEVISGFEIGHYFSGWCFVLKRPIWESIGGLDEDFKFWYADNATIEQLKNIGVVPHLLRDSIVTHLGSRTLLQMDGNTIDELTNQQYNIFRKKYNK